MQLLENFTYEDGTPIGIKIQIPKYLRPRVGFRGSVMCEIKHHSISEKWEDIKVEIIAVNNKNQDKFPYKGIDNEYNDARLLPFSADNPPLVGMRFKEVGNDNILYIGKCEYTWVEDNHGDQYDYSNIIFIDFEEIPDE